MSKNEEMGERFYKFALKIVGLVSKLPKEMVAQKIGKQNLKP
jgi:hypothetical protein